MSTLGQKRLQRRLVIHHLPLLILSTLSVALLFYTRPYADVLSRASFATAYPALGLLALTLAIGPFHVLTKRRNPASGDLRRDFGIWAGILGILHSAIGQNVHLRGRPWLYYVYAAKEHKAFPIRHDLFGVANYTGALSGLLLIVLLATSNDYSIRKLGTPGWKRISGGTISCLPSSGPHYRLPDLGTSGVSLRGGRFGLSCNHHCPADCRMDEPKSRTLRGAVTSFPSSRKSV